MEISAEGRYEPGPDPHNRRRQHLRPLVWTQMDRHAASWTGGRRIRVYFSFEKVWKVRPSWHAAVSDFIAFLPVCWRRRRWKACLWASWWPPERCHSPGISSEWIVCVSVYEHVFLTSPPPPAHTHACSHMHPSCRIFHNELNTFWYTWEAFINYL